MITLYWDNTQRGLESLQVQENDSSYRSRGLMQRPQLVLKFALPRYVEIPVGAYCNYQGERFVLTSPQNIKKQGTRNIEYTLTMGTYQDNMSLYKMRNTVDGRLKYSMCSTPAEFVAEIVANLNARDGVGVWSVGDCIDTAPKTIEFNHTYCDAALSMVADEFETEWEIENHTIHLHTVKYNENAPLPLSYGKGNGFVPGIGRATPVGEMPIKRLYVQGGNRNIDRSTYGHPDLMLPYNQTIAFDGEKFEDETGFDSTKARTYQTDNEGYSIRRIDESTDSTKEDSIDCSDRYPSRVGVVSSVVEVDASRNFYDFIDNTIPNDLDYTACLIEGETMTVIFQTGMLAGKEFDVKFHYNNKRFEIVPFEYDGITMPVGNAWLPAIGDTYIVFGCMLPAAYICDNATKSGASWEMFRMAVRYLYANEDQKFTFTGKLQAMWSRANWGTIGQKLVVGGYIHFSDTQFAPDGTDIRIVGIKDYLTDPYAPTIDISNGIVGQSVTTTLVQVGCQEVTIGEAYDNSINFTKRRFRDAYDTMLMLQESLLEFSEGINPITVQTMQLLIGDASLQYVFVEENSGTVWPSSSIFYMNNETMRLSVVNPSSADPQLSLILRHSKLGNTMQSGHDYTEWTMTPFVSQVLSNAEQGYYLYAKCEKESTNNGDQGVFVLETEAKGMEYYSGYYMFLVGIVGKIHNGERSFVTLYGFTELLPGRVTTDLIISSDGNSYFNLATGRIVANDALIRGTIRGPFHNSTHDSAAWQNFDNIYFDDPDYGQASVRRYVRLEWGTEQSGRKITIVGTGFIMQPPNGQYIYMNGVGYSSQIRFCNEILTLVGYGDENTFYGWIVASRRQWNVGVGYHEGRDMRALAFGNVKLSKSNVEGQSVVTASLEYGASDGSTLAVTRVSAGIYTVGLPIGWFAGDSNASFAADRCLVLATGTEGATYNVAVTNKTYDSTNQLLNIWFHVADNNGYNVDAGFNFIIYGAMQWLNYYQGL